MAGAFDEEAFLRTVAALPDVLIALWLALLADGVTEGNDEQSAMQEAFGSAMQGGATERARL